MLLSQGLEMEQYACSPEYLQKDTFESSFPTSGKNRPTKTNLDYPIIFILPRILAILQQLHQSDFSCFFTCNDM